MYSGLAEANRIYTVLSFLHHYMNLYSLILPTPCTIHVHCNNSGVINQITNTSQCLYPWDAICNDYPIYTEIQVQLKALSSIRALFYHVKGHQKETAEWKLTLPEWLNIDCKKQASSMPPISANSPTCANPLTPAGYLHLCIHNQCVIQCIQHTLGMMQLLSNLSLNTCSTNMNGAILQHKQSIGPQFDWHWSDLMQMTIGLWPSLFMSGSHFRTTTSFFANPHYICVLLLPDTWNSQPSFSLFSSGLKTDMERFTWIAS